MRWGCLAAAVLVLGCPRSPSTSGDGDDAGLEADGGHDAGPIFKASLVGVWDDVNARFLLAPRNEASVDATVVLFGEAGDLPLLGDWDGDGTATVGVYRPSALSFFLRNSLTSGAAETATAFGTAGDLPVVGDWNADGKDDLGVYRPAERKFFLTTSLNDPNSAVTTVNFSTLESATDAQPVAGDWDGNGTADVGLYVPSTAAFKLATSTNPAAFAHAFTLGTPGAAASVVAGDWDANGSVTVGLWSPTTGEFFLRNTLAVTASATAPESVQFLYGPPASANRAVSGRRPSP